jgi:hypothetical protein
MEGHGSKAEEYRIAEQLEHMNQYRIFIGDIKSVDFDSIRRAIRKTMLHTVLAYVEIRNQ